MWCRTPRARSTTPRSRSISTTSAMHRRSRIPTSSTSSRMCRSSSRSRSCSATTPTSIAIRSTPVSWRYPDFIDELIHGDLNGTITVNQNGDLVFTPDLNATRSGGFHHTITDNADGTAEGFVDINIIPVNDEPTAVADDGGVTPLDVPLVLRVSDLMANDFDVDDEDGLFAALLRRRGFGQRRHFRGGPGGGRDLHRRPGLRPDTPARSRSSTASPMPKAFRTSAS